MGKNVFCIDASCFLSLQKQRDLLRVIRELRKENPYTLEIYIPNHIYDTILLPPEKKFLRLKEILKDWKESNTDLEFEDIEMEEYVNNTRHFLSEYKPKPVPEEISNMEKIGTESIYKKDLLEKFGTILADIMWETVSVSEKLGARVISFGEKTISFISKLGSKIRKGYSKRKKRIKHKSEIASQLRFWIFSMISETAAAAFIHEFQIDLPFIPLTQIPLGLLIVADG